jgi:SAM-dependent methyltransferase
MLLEVGCESPDEFTANGLFTSASRCNVATPRFASLGSGNCDTEVRLARLLLERGLRRFRIDCIDVNAQMLERGRALAADEGCADYIAFVEGDLNDWRPEHTYQGIFANQSLHHVTNLELLLERVDAALDPAGSILVNDMIGRNGHQRWPEALEALHRFWEELPDSYRYNRQLERLERTYENWDCSQHGFEGIRSQDILPLLVDRFSFEIFIAFGNVIDVFVDRGFGHNFDASAAWDRDFVDRVHAFDERGLAAGTLTPTHLIAMLGKRPADAPHYARNLSPRSTVRDPDRAPGTT